MSNKSRILEIALQLDQASWTENALYLSDMATELEAVAADMCDCD